MEKNKTKQKPGAISNSHGQFQREKMNERYDTAEYNHNYFSPMRTRG